MPDWKPLVSLVNGSGGASHSMCFSILSLAFCLYANGNDGQADEKRRNLQAVGGGDSTAQQSITGYTQQNKTRDTVKKRNIHEAPRTHAGNPDDQLPSVIAHFFGLVCHFLLL